MDIKTSIITRVKLLCGDPIVKLLDEEKEVLSIAFKLAYENYWIHYPYIGRIQQQLGDSSIIKLPFSEIISRVFDDSKMDLRNKTYLLGLTRINEQNGYLASGNSGSPLEAWLTGINGRNITSNQNDFVSTYNTYKYSASLKGAFSGTLKPEFDEVLQELRLISPLYSYGNCLIDIAFGFRYDDSSESSENASLQILNKNLMLIFNDLVTKYFLEGIISGRTLVKVSGDYDISVEALSSKLAEIKTKLEKDLANSTYKPIMWG